MAETLSVPPQTAAPRRWIVFAHALAFVLGFSLIFTVGWGGAVTVLGQLFGQYKLALGRIGGVVVILFGLATLDVIRTPGSMPTPALNTPVHAVRLPARP